MLTYIGVLELSLLKAKFRKRTPAERFQQRAPLEPAEIREHQMDTVHLTKKYLVVFMIAAISLELLDLVFRGYTAVKSWDILREVIYEMDFTKIFILQYGLGNLLPFIMLIMPRLTLRRTVVALLLVLFGVFMMRWNVVIGGQSFSLTFAGFMHYHLPIIPHDMVTFKEGLFGALTVMTTPFVLLWLINFILPVLPEHKKH